MRMRTTIAGYLVALIVSLSGCQSSEHKIITLRAGGKAFTTFSSAPEEPAQVRLQLLTDSTFRLSVIPHEGASSQDMQGRLSVSDGHYQLFFPDTVSQLNQLITPVHPDASVVVYPDRSVALDKTLTQFYVRGTLVTSDTLAAR